MKLNIHPIITPLGEMISISDENGIILLHFVDSPHYSLIRNNVLPNDPIFIDEANKHQLLLKRELKNYFNNQSKDFTVPLHLNGTAFQQRVWRQTQMIPFGKTVSYEQQAVAMSNLKGIRALAKANGDNPILILIPCHRIIGKDGNLKGYAGGIERKKSLLELEGAFGRQTNLFQP